MKQNKNQPHLDEVTFAAGEQLFEEGSPTDGIYLLREGEVDIYAGGKKLARLDRPATIISGATAVLELPHGSTAIARSDTVVRKVKMGFEDLLEEKPPGWSRLLKNLLRTAATRGRRGTPEAPGTQAAGV